MDIQRSNFLYGKLLRSFLPQSRNMRLFSDLKAAFQGWRTEMSAFLNILSLLFSNIENHCAHFCPRLVICILFPFQNPFGMHFAKKMHTRSVFQLKKYALFFFARRSHLFVQEKVHTFSLLKPFWYALCKGNAYQILVLAEKVCIVFLRPAEPLI